jgi:hypothetical protein
MRAVDLCALEVLDLLDVVSQGMTLHQYHQFLGAIDRGVGERRKRAVTEAQGDAGPNAMHGRGNHNQSPVSAGR